MKIPLLWVGFGAVSFLPVAILAADRAPALSPLVAISRYAGTPAEVLTIGTSRERFLALKGLPDAWLSADCGVYWDQSSNRPEHTREHDTLIVEFTRGRVQGLRLVPSAPVRQFLAALHRRNPAALLADDYATRGLRTH